jgi:hypothetical protein
MRYKLRHLVAFVINDGEACILQAPDGQLGMCRGTHRPSAEISVYVRLFAGIQAAAHLEAIT